MPQIGPTSKHKPTVSSSELLQSGPSGAAAEPNVDGLLSKNAWPAGPNSTDIQYLNALAGKPYMMPVSPWFYTPTSQVKTGYGAGTTCGTNAGTKWSIYSPNSLRSLPGTTGANRTISPRNPSTSFPSPPAPHGTSTQSRIAHG
jgi:hypothetical protein